MGRYLAIHHGAAGDDETQEITPARQQAFLEAWGTWAGNCSAALVDPGAPLLRTRVVTRGGDVEVTDTKTG